MAMITTGQKFVSGFVSRRMSILAIYLPAFSLAFVLNTC